MSGAGGAGKRAGCHSQVAKRVVQECTRSQTKTERDWRVLHFRNLRLQTATAAARLESANASREAAEARSQTGRCQAPQDPPRGTAPHAVMAFWQDWGTGSKGSKWRVQRDLWGAGPKDATSDHKGDVGAPRLTYLGAAQRGEEADQSGGQARQLQPPVFSQPLRGNAAAAGPLPRPGAMRGSGESGGQVRKAAGGQCAGGGSGRAQGAKATAGSPAVSKVQALNCDSGGLPNPRHEGRGNYFGVLAQQDHGDEETTTAAGGGEGDLAGKGQQGQQVQQPDPREAKTLEAARERRTTRRRLKRRALREAARTAKAGLEAPLPRLEPKEKGPGEDKTSVERAALTGPTRPLQETTKGKDGKNGGGASDSGLAAFMEFAPALLMLMLQAFFGSSAAPRKLGVTPSSPDSLTDTLRRYHTAFLS